MSRTATVIVGLLMAMMLGVSGLAECSQMSFTSANAPGVTKSPAAEPNKTAQLATGQAKSMKLRFSSPIAAVAVISKYQKFYLSEITKRTKGRITFEEHWGGSLVGPAEVLDAPGKGVIDLGMGLWIYAPGKVPLGNFEFNFPFNDPKMRTQVKIKREMFNKIPALNGELAKFNIAPPPTFSAVPAYNLLSRQPIRSLEDLKGKRIGHTPVEFTEAFKAAGAVSVISPATEYYQRLERGVIDGLCLPLVLQDIFKLSEVAKHYTAINLITTVPYTIWINADKWKSLNKEDQKIFLEVGKEADEVQVAALEAQEGASRAKYEKDGVTFYTMPAADIERWMKSMPDIVAEWAKKMESQGHPGWKIADTYLELMQREGWKFPRKWGVR